MLVNDQLDVHFFFVYVYSKSLQVSSSYVLIIRRINCIMLTVWYAYRTVTYIV
jgi:hypothetical protein